MMNSRQYEIRILVAGALLLLFSGIGGAGGQSADPFAQITRNYSKFDLDRDGSAEIESMLPCPWELEGQPAMRDDHLLLILIDARLMPMVDAPVLDGRGTGSPRLSTFAVWDLAVGLQQWGGDLADAGYTPKFLRIQLYDGDKHQDGKTLLALRSMIAAVRNAYPKLAGVMLVGSFPDALIARRWIGSGNTSDGTRALRIAPAYIASRSDIVLADLDGGWERLYIGEPRAVPTLELVPEKIQGNWPLTGQILESSQFAFSSATLQDCFYIQDDTYVAPAGWDKPRLKLQLDLTRRNPEVGTAERGALNPLAIPEIVVSRIDARHAAMDASGRADFVLERRLLAEYFERVHRRHATTAASMPGFVSAPADGVGVADRRGPMPLTAKDVTLPDLLRWFALPATLRVIDAPADAAGLHFGTAYKASQLGALTKRTFSATTADGLFTPALIRALWQGGIRAGGNCIYLLPRGESCRPAFAETDPYRSGRYGSGQIGESLLFCLNGVALLGSSWNSGEPMPAVLPGDENLGQAWLNLYRSESGRAVKADADDAKRCYAWVLLGDWTLPVR